MVFHKGLYEDLHFFLIYIYDLPRGLLSDDKLLADDTFLFSIVNCVKTSASALNRDLLNIQNRAYQWKMPFNLELTNHKRLYFPERQIRLICTHPPLYHCTENEVFH